MKTYKENIIKYEAELRRTSKILNRISLIRLLLFVISSVTIITLLSFNLVSSALVILPMSIVAFGVAIRLHSKTAFLKIHTSFLKSINESEIERLENKLGAFDTGNQFSKQNHPYTADLDIYGPHSIFQLLNRTTTESGRMLLAGWLSEPAGNEEIASRQEAIKELSLKPDWRQDFQASGMHYQNRKSDYSKLLNWIKAPVVLLKSRGRYLATAIILSVLSLLGFYFFMTNLVAANLNSSNWFIFILPFVMVLVVNHFVLRKIYPAVEKIVLTSQQNINTLKGYQALIEKIENENFNSQKLHSLQATDGAMPRDALILIIFLFTNILI